ncbi:glycosyltransferase family 9 protein [Mycobacterium sp. ELW1]|uniref:glycosyltransferase family 9 protein n=1 Tax=Mycobacterium sp. ELW1 TaxID=1547487 RepID=UPI00143CF82C|nr:glycosyltransferase family 9 protein [Mycobacterium sp. ELW1]
METFGRSFPRSPITVFTRPELADIYRHNPHVDELRFAAFPVGSAKNTGIGEVRRLWCELGRIRRQRYDLVVNCEGGLGENVLAWLMSPRHNSGPIWSIDHPRNSFFRTGLGGLIRYPVTVPVDVPDVYSAMDELARGLGAMRPAKSRLYASGGRELRCREEAEIIGIHPLASQAGKLWAAERWRELIRILRSRGRSVVLFGASSERERLAALIPDPTDEMVTIETLPLLEFFEKLTEVRTLVCLDSFAAHVAAAIETPAVILTGSGMSEVWTPPGAEVIDGGKGYPPPDGVRCGDGLASGMQRIALAEVVATLERLGVL